MTATTSSLEAVARRFELSPDSLRRHFRAHVTEGFKRAAKIGPFESEERLRSLCAEAGTSVLENYRAIYSGLAHRWACAVEGGSDHSVVQLSRAMQENLALQGRITRELAPTSVTVNAFVSSDWLKDLGLDLMGLVRKHPDIRGDLKAILERRIGGADRPLLNVTPEGGEGGDGEP